VAGLKLGVPREYFVEGMDPEVEASVREALKAYERLGATLVDVSLPHTKYALATYYLLAPAEASSNLARYDGVRYGRRARDAKGLRDMYGLTRDQGFGPEVKRRIMLGTYALSAGYYDAYYLKAQKVRTLIREDFTKAFTQVDALVTPTSPVPAFKLGEKVDDPLSMYLMDVCTLPCNLAGLPGLSLPCGFTKAGLPIGLQLMGRPFDEAKLLRIARAFEREHDYVRRPAPI
jgi:aspartyl-tRNA(Asn)/glutamyl-tRNA(Gln) amidotransferase subunit A